LIELEIEKDTPATQQFCAWHSTNPGRATQWFVDKLLAAKNVHQGI